MTGDKVILTITQRDTEASLGRTKRIDGDRNGQEQAQVQGRGQGRVGIRTGIAMEAMVGMIREVRPGGVAIREVDMDMILEGRVTGGDESNAL